jgi:hypothetical protein
MTESTLETLKVHGVFDKCLEGLGTYSVVAGIAWNAQLGRRRVTLKSKPPIYILNYNRRKIYSVNRQFLTSMHLDSFSIISIREYHVDQSQKTSAERTGQFFRPFKKQRNGRTNTGGDGQE